MKKYIPVIILLFLAFLSILVINLNNYYAKKNPVRLLPILGNKTINNFDTTFHSILNFTFVNQLGDTITENNIKNKNIVVEYFFTTCQSICPIMNENMMKVAKAFENDSNLKILSHTVKPEEDSVSALLLYAQQHYANNKNWWFLTGNKKDLYSTARKSYLLNGEEGNGDSDDFIHTQLFALVDKQKHIRGFYDGTNDAEITKLIKDIELLKTEQEHNIKLK